MRLVSSSPSAPPAAAPIESAVPPKPRPAPRPAPPPAGAVSIARYVDDAAARHGVPASLVAAVIAVESKFNSRAVSQRGALGLMQLMPGTAALLGVRDAFDPRENVEAGARHLRELLDRFANDVALALAAYNAGPQAVIKHGGVPPYPETQAFVARVLARAENVLLPRGADEHPRDGVVWRATAHLRPDEETFAPIVRYAVLTDDLGISTRSLPSPSTEVAVVVEVNESPPHAEAP